MTPEQFRTERERLGLSQAELGAAFEKPRQTIARWERGDMAIQHPAIMRLAFEALHRRLTGRDHLVAIAE